jgi:hypothetical protein
MSKDLSSGAVAGRKKDKIEILGCNTCVPNRDDIHFSGRNPTYKR